jgi:hypothetical protein
MSKILTIFLAITMFSFCFTTADPVFAHDNADEFAELMKFYHDHSQPLKDNQLNNFIKRIRNSIQNKEIKVHSKIKDLDFERAKGYKFDEGLENIDSYYVTIPLKNLPDGSPESISGLTVGFNDSYVIQEYGEIIVNEKNKTYKIKAYKNGKYEGSTTITKHSSQEYGTIKPMSYMDDVVDCMDRYGVNPDTAKAVVATCGLVCSITLGTGCIVCLGVFGAAGSGVIVGCFINP